MSKTARLASVGALILIAFACLVFTDWVGESAVRAVDDLLLPLLSAIAALFSVAAAGSAQGRIRSGWVAMAVALAGFAIGEAIWCYDDLILQQSPFPSPADGFFLIFPVGVCVALLFFRTPTSRQSQGQILLDGLIVAGSLFIVSWTLVMKQIYEAGAATRLEVVLLIAYPVADLVILTVAAVVVFSARSGQRLTTTLLGLGVIAMALADTGYAYLSAQQEYVAGNRIDTVWVAGLLLLTLAAAVGRQARFEDRQRDEPPGWASFWFPYAPLIAAVAVVATQPLSVFASAPVLPVAVLLVICVLARQALAVNENRRLLAKVAEQAMRDPLTGLANRALFQDRLDRAMQSRHSTGAPIGVLILDLDDFKLINDSLGHAAGDELLQKVGQRISTCAGSDETVARLGGDEFAVMSVGNRDRLEAIGDRVVKAFTAPVTVEGQDVVMRPSIGLAVTAADEPDVSAEELLKRADLAMYAAKRSRESIRSFSRQMQEEHSRDDQARLLRELRGAVDRNELTLVYQPKFDLKSGTLAGVEALLRWPHPDRGVLTPDEFLPLVRRHGLIDAVTDFVITTALDDARDWHTAGADVAMAINVFPPSLAALQLPGRLDHAVRARGLRSSSLTVEITEDALLDDIDRTRTVLRELRERGISVAIDDFGSGYSALWYLRDLPVDQVKLDRSFIAPIVVDPRAAAVARAVIDLAHVLCMTTVAEGVENAETADWLRLHGCDIVQGYYFSPPLTAAGVLSLRAPVSAKSN